MSYRTDVDNIYPLGSTITAKENPTTNLVIVKYYQRIYYCQSVAEPEAKQRVYFERELNAPRAVKDSLW